jgi:hypothetical protein
MPQEAITVLEQAIDPNADQEELWILPTLAAAYANPAVGRIEDAKKTVKKIIALKPGFSTSEVLSRNPYQTKDLADRYVNALRRAGLPD